MRKSGQRQKESFEIASVSVTVLAGGVGGSKLVTGLAAFLDPDRLMVVGNVGDDINLHGLWISPDIDILTYSLAGMVDQEKGWGFKDDTFEALEALGKLGEETWFRLGNRDLATHILRTRLRHEGLRATEIARRIARQLEVAVRILPATDDEVQTMVRTDSGWLNFQEYLVRERCRPQIREIRYSRSEKARPSKEVLRAIEESDLIVIAPSNPIASIGPILAVPGIREALAKTTVRKIAVSPIVGGRSLKGPSDKMMQSFNLELSPVGIASYYGSLIDALVIDSLDAGFEEKLQKRGLDVLITPTIMQTDSDRLALARRVLAFCRIEVNGQS